ncbi:methyl-accepting chemotaxis protein [Paraliobacillus sediminis]|uniref:methyl-accepting chemotaxis protein n=1 Tax=Paraliobacillus sediminis TaxID=1885916 RepID=UPI000E3D2F11|nr:methyl-accepting chemotaxis protein [Paraliobacillus sediminis]
MKIRLSLFVSFLLVILLHTALFGYSIFALVKVDAFSFPIIVAFAVVVIVSFAIAHFSSLRIVKQLKQTRERLEILASDKVEELPETNMKNEEFIQLNEEIDLVIDKTKNAVKFISTITDHLNKQSSTLHQYTDDLEKDSSYITTTMQEISSGAEEQANSASSLTETMQKFSNTIMSVVLNGENIKEESKSMLSITDEGSQLMHQSVDKMSVIDDTIKQSLDKVRGLDAMTLKITKVVTVIKEVAEQTNLLALNAAIEAARAGEHGKGFAVVADEVRKLAEQVSLSVTDITETTSGIQYESKEAVEALERGYQAVNEGSSQIQTTGSTFDKLNVIITNIGKEIEDVSNNLYDVLDNTKVINDSITNIASVSEESAAGIQEAESASERLSGSVENIRIGQEELETGIRKLNI